MKTTFNEYNKLYEYNNQDETWIFNYFNQEGYEKQLNGAYHCTWRIEKFLDSIDLDDYFTEEEQEEIQEYIDDEIPEELIEYFDTNKKTKFISDFADYFEDSDCNWNYHLPSNYYLDYPTKLKNQWLIYCDKDAKIDDIWRNGFIDGFDDIGEITSSHRTYTEGRYNVAYTIYDFENHFDDENPKPYSMTGDEQDSFLMFRNSGIRVYHSGNEKYYTIFSGHEKGYDIIALERGESEQDENGWEDVWYVESRKLRTQQTQRLYEDISIHKVIEWVENNYDQYRKHLESPSRHLITKIADDKQREKNMKKYQI